MISFNIELCTNPDICEAVGSEWIEFGERGILHISCLDRFPSNYIEGVFTPKDLLQLFTSLCIVSKLSSDEYLMPCVLPVEEKAFCNPEPETQPVPAMVVEFPNGGPMLGLFCGLVCYLINAGRWQIESLSTSPGAASISQFQVSLAKSPSMTLSPLSSWSLSMVLQM